jgi:uncharacterized protein (UPF0212 family)
MSDAPTARAIHVWAPSKGNLWPECGTWLNADEKLDYNGPRPGRQLVRTQFPGRTWVVFQSSRTICLALTDLLLVLAAFALSLAAIGAYGHFPAFWAIPPVVLSNEAAPVGLVSINSVGNIVNFLGPSIVGIVSGTALSSDCGDVAANALYTLGASFVVASLLLVGLKYTMKRGYFQVNCHNHDRRIAE